MADDADFEERPVRWVMGGSVAALAVIAVWSLSLFWTDSGPSTGEEARQREVAVVTFIVGGMMKSRSGAT